MNKKLRFWNMTEQDRQIIYERIQKLKVLGFMT